MEKLHIEESKSYNLAKQQAGLNFYQFLIIFLWVLLFFWSNWFHNWGWGQLVDFIINLCCSWVFTYIFPC